MARRKIHLQEIAKIKKNEQVHLELSLTYFRTRQSVRSLRNLYQNHTQKKQIFFTLIKSHIIVVNDETDCSSFITLGNTCKIRVRRRVRFMWFLRGFRPLRSRRSQNRMSIKLSRMRKQRRRRTEPDSEIWIRNRLCPLPRLRSYIL